MSFVFSYEKTYIPFSAQIFCSSCFKSINSSQVHSHPNYCPYIKDSYFFYLSSECKTFIDEKLKTRIRRLQILNSIINSSDKNQIPLEDLEKITKKIKKISQISSTYLEKKNFSPNEIIQIEKRVLVQVLVINIPDVHMKKVPSNLLYWEIPQIKDSRLNLKFFYKILDLKPIENHIEGNCLIKYNELLVFEFPKFLAIYSLELNEYIRIIYLTRDKYSYPNEIYHTKNFTHLIYFQENFLIFWNIYEEYEERRIDLGDSLIFHKITEDYRYASFLSFDGLALYDLMTDNWKYIELPYECNPLRNICEVATWSFKYSENFQLFLTKKLIWHRPSDKFLKIPENPFEHTDTNTIFLTSNDTQLVVINKSLIGIYSISLQDSTASLIPIKNFSIPEQANFSFLSLDQSSITLISKTPENTLKSLLISSISLPDCTISNYKTDFKSIPNLNLQNCSKTFTSFYKYIKNFEEAEFDWQVEYNSIYRSKRIFKTFHKYPGNRKAKGFENKVESWFNVSFKKRIYESFTSPRIHLIAFQRDKVIFFNVDKKIPEFFTNIAPEKNSPDSKVPNREVTNSFRFLVYRNDDLFPNCVLVQKIVKFNMK